MGVCGLQEKTTKHREASEHKSQVGVAATAPNILVKGVSPTAATPGMRFCGRTCALLPSAGMTLHFIFKPVHYIAN